MKVGYQILADLQQQQAFKQWGFTNNTGRPYITFPFKFSNVFTAISCICHNGSPSEANTVYNVSISGMNIGASGGGSGKYWCAFGVAQQQWGKTISGNNVKTKFPIAFTAFCMLSVSVNSSNGNAAESVFRNGFGYTNKTLSDWILRGPTGDATYFADYIAIGCQPQWGNGSSSSFSKKDYATPKDIGTVTISTPISMSTLYQGFICASSTSGPSLFVGFVTAYSGNSLTVRLITSLDSGSGGSLVPNYILLGH